VSEVTVFINGAQVTRHKAIDLLPGNSTLKFVGLSPYIDTKSLQVKANGDVMVLSVNHQFNYIDSAVRSNELVDLTNKIKDMDDKIKVENVNLDIINDELTFLNDNRNIGGKNQELSLLNLKETFAFYKDGVSSLKMKKIEVNKNIEKLTREKTALENQVNQMSTSQQTPTSEVLVKVNAKAPCKCDMELSYFVKNAGWYPSYDIRAKSIDGPIELVYKANIHQNTKEDWKNVRLRLSSSNPNLGSVAPQLQTYFLNYYTSAPRYSNINNEVSGRVTDATTGEPLIGVSIAIQGTTIGTVSDAQGSYSLSVPNNQAELEIAYVGYQTVTVAANKPVINVELAPDVKMLNEAIVVGYGTNKKAEKSRVLRRSMEVPTLTGSVTRIPVEQVENQTSVEFDIKTPYTLASDNKNLTVDIDDYSLDATYEYYCVPKADNDAFLTASVVNWEKYNLLAGEANIFFENTFVGKSILDVRYVSDTLRLSLGRDKNVVVKREKIRDFSTKQFLGNKKEETRDWKISLRNSKKQPINITLYDQVPVSTNAEIEVSTENVSGGTLTKETGVVKWMFTLQPSEKKELELKYSVKYPKDKILIIE
jgi:hypothetical protein